MCGYPGRGRQDDLTNVASLLLDDGLSGPAGHEGRDVLLDD